jgi:selenocysteine-specific elongation factor
MDRARLVPGVVGLGGHTDHGKSTLIHRLTGRDPDRLPIEKLRGMTTDMGFAHLDLADGRKIGLVDVPGHERYVRHAVAGASAVRGALLVVAADEGVMPQTREHLQIFNLLGVRHGLVALTRIDLTDKDMAALAREEVEELVAGTFLEGRPILPVSSLTGEGIAELADAIEDMSRTFPEEGIDDRVFRMSLQRVFLSRGHGTVVTGIPFHGGIRRGEELEIVETGARVRARRITAYGEEILLTQGPHAVGVNLAGLRGEVQRGFTLATPGRMVPGRFLEVRFGYLASFQRPLSRSTRLHFHHGTMRCEAVLHLLDRHSLNPGESCFAQLRLDKPVCVVERDRFLLRRPSPGATLGGGVVLGVSNEKRRARNLSLVSLELGEQSLASDRTLILHLLAEAGVDGMAFTDLSAHTLLSPITLHKLLERLETKGHLVLMTQTLRYLGADTVRRMERDLLHLIRRLLTSSPLHGHLEKPALLSALGWTQDALDTVLSRLLLTGQIRFNRNRIGLPAECMEPEELAHPTVQAVLEHLASFDLMPVPRDDLLTSLPGPTEEIDRALGVLIRAGGVRALAESRFVTAKAVDRARSLLRDLFSAAPDSPLGFVSVKHAYGVSNSIASAWLEYFYQEEDFLMRKENLFVLKEPSAPCRLSPDNTN